jgi:Tol biopolymer transport system component
VPIRSRGSVRSRALRSSRAVVAVVLTLVAGCAPGRGPAESPSGSSVPAPAPSPALVNVHVDVPAARASHLTAASGGSITATSGGVTYTLTIPPGALAADSDIAVYPVTSIAGLPPEAKLRAAVHLTPEGLALQVPATLTMSLPSSASTSAGVGLAYHGDGLEVHRRPSLVTAGAVTMQIVHFSGYADVEAFQAQVPVTAKGEQDEDLLLLHWELRASKAELAQDLRTWYLDVVRPALDSAEHFSLNDVLDPADGDRINLEYFAWLLAIDWARAVTGDPTFTVGEVDDSIPRAVRFVRLFYLGENSQCLNRQDDPNTASAMFWGILAYQTAVARSAAISDELGERIDSKADKLDKETLLDDNCVKVVIDPDRSYSAARPGESGTVKLRAGFVIGDGPTRYGVPAYPVYVLVSRTGSDEGANPVIAEEETGNVEVDLGWPDKVDPISIDIEATLYAAGSNTTIERFDRFTKGSKPSRIAFVSNRGDGNPQIWVMDSDGTHPKQLTHNPLGRLPTTPAWSPDGTKIAFSDNREGGEMHLWLMNADGTDQQRLTPDDAISSYPSWSPDGTRIAYTRYDAASHPTTHIALIDVAQGTVVDLTMPAKGADFRPTWSPDGSKIAFSSNRSGHSQVYVVDVTTRVVTQLTPDAGITENRNPSWSPDGTRLAFTHVDGKYSVETLSADGTGTATVVASDLVTETAPVWAPDGGRLAFWELVPSTGGGEATTALVIAVANVDGTGLQTLTPTDSSSFAPAWSR